MELIKFIENNKSDWREKLQKPPYNLIVKESEDYTLLKYNQLESNFSQPIVKECRGIILDKNNKIVCYPFEKFWNFCESYADTIDWNSARVLDKIDGSLLKLWHDNGKWHWATNGNINADTLKLCLNYMASIQCPYKTWGELIRSAINYKDIDFNTLNKNYTYMFELVSPYTKIVIPYAETKLYHLATRDNTTFQELETNISVEKPKSYSVSTLDDCIKAAENLSKDFEGFVVVDKYYHRIKVKNPIYLMLHRAANNNQISISRILELIKVGDEEEFIGYFPEYIEVIYKIKSIINKFELEMKREYEEAYNLSTKEERKNVALFINSNLRWKDYCLKQIYSNKKQTAHDYLFSMVGDKLRDLVKAELEKK